MRHFSSVFSWTLTSILWWGLFVGVGCSPSAPTQTRDSGPLSQIAKAYVEATNKLNRPPLSIEDLTPHFPPGTDANSLLNSPTDGKPYVIIWGTDPRQGMDLKPLVIGYEAEGMGGARFVFTAMGVSLMGDADFKEAKFPTGHTPQ